MLWSQAFSWFSGTCSGIWTTAFIPFIAHAYDSDFTLVMSRMDEALRTMPIPAYSCFYKPIEIEEMLQFIEEICERNNQQKE